MRLLVRDLDLEETPGTVRATNVLRHVDDSWKVLLLVTRRFLADDWAAFTLLMAQQSVSHLMPDRVLVAVFDRSLPAPPATLTALLRVTPERNVFCGMERGAGPDHPQWQRLADAILT